ncbi:hypothetical protein [Paraburkholderia aspalathi]|uniref:hypothetical protein n=1 Tax=Paraburkholderia aspalathi TaxID=1324617 RepID=UPI00190A2AC7|nr:hypothetical protein [Paraburkholderia aspalathi]MBK3844272.1 hypothetical protein [Paraburkholderia aspalathi]
MQLTIQQARKGTIASNLLALRRFSKWLGEKDLGSLTSRRHDRTLDVDAKAFMNGPGGDRNASGALNNLRKMKVKGIAASGVDSEDRQLIDRCEKAAVEGGADKSTVSQYMSYVRVFSTWLLSDTDGIAARLMDPWLDLEARHCATTTGRSKVPRALTYLRENLNIEAPQSSAINRQIVRASELLVSPTRSIDEVAEVSGIPGRALRQLLSEESGKCSLTQAGRAFIKALGNVGLATVIDANLRLRNQAAAQQASQLEPQYYSHIGPELPAGSANQANSMAGYSGLSGHRSFFENPDAWGVPPSPASSVNQADSMAGYSGLSGHRSFFENPDAWGVPPSPAGSVNQGNSMAGYSGLSGHRSFFENPDAWGVPPSPASSVNQETSSRRAAPSSSTMPRFDESDTRGDWQHGNQLAPQWLLDRGVLDQQIVEICGQQYRVAAMPGTMTHSGEPLTCLYEHLRGG